MLKKLNGLLVLVLILMCLSWIRYADPRQNPIFSVIAINPQDTEIQELIGDEAIESIFVIGSNELPFIHPKVKVFPWDKKKSPLKEIYPLIQKLSPDTILVVLTENLPVDKEFILNLKKAHAKQKVWCTYGLDLAKKVSSSKNPMHFSLLSQTPTWIAAKAALFQKIDIRHFIFKNELIDEAWAEALMIPVIEMSVSHSKPIATKLGAIPHAGISERYAQEIEALRKKKIFPNLSCLKEKKTRLDLFLFLDHAVEDLLAYYETQHAKWQNGYAIVPKDVSFTALEKKYPSFCFIQQGRELCMKTKKALRQSSSEYIVLISPGEKKQIDLSLIDYVSKNFSRGLVCVKKHNKDAHLLMENIASFPVGEIEGYVLSIHPRHMLIKKLLRSDFQDFEGMKKAIFSGKSKDIPLFSL